MRLTESSSALRGSVSAEWACRAQERRDRLKVVLDAVVDLLREHAAHHRAAVLERDGCVVAIDVSSARSSAVKGVSRSKTSSPICRRFQRSGSRTACAPGASFGPGDVAVLEHERGTGRTDRLHRRLDDRLEGLLQVERLGDGLGDLRQRLQLGDAPLRLRVELRVLDRLRDLCGDGDEQLDLVVRESRGSSVRTFSAPASRSRARIGTARIDSYCPPAGWRRA